MEKQYTYSVARVRALETKLLTAEMMEQLLTGQSFEEGYEFLKSRGFGDPAKDLSADEMMCVERRKLFRLLSELLDDPKEYAVLTLQDQYHNLKAAIKQVCSEQEIDFVFMEDVLESPEFLKRCLKEGRFNSLSKGMQQPAKEAMETLLKTGDGQLCDIIIDRATLSAIKDCGEHSENDFVKQYADMLVTMADIKITLRAMQSGRDEQFLDNALVACGGVSISELKNAASGGKDAIFAYLESIGYGKGVRAFQISPSVFECWCDNQIIELARTMKYQSFTIGPILAYALAKLSEIKTVKIILLGLQHGLGSDFIRERVRKTYE